MKKNKPLICILTISVLGFASLFTPTTYFATEGGQVGHEALIEFYRDDPDEKKPSSPSKSIDEPKVSKKASESKPVGRYPQTGEIVKKSLTLSGVILAVSAIYVYMKKQRKERKGEDKP